MKKLLFIMLLACVGSSARGQVGALTVTNNNPICSALVYMYAVDTAVSLGNDKPCNIVSGLIRVPPGGSSAVWADLDVFFMGAPGFASFATPVTGSWTTTSFAWTDAAYQYECPLPCIGNGGDVITEGMTPLWGSYSCYMQGLTGGAIGSCTIGGVWHNLTGAGIMDNIEIIID